MTRRCVVRDEATKVYVKYNTSIKVLLFVKAYRSPTYVVSRKYIRPIVQQQLTHRLLAKIGPYGFVQGSIAEIFGAHDISTTAKQHLHHVDVVEIDPCVEWSVAFVVLLVDIGATIDEEFG